MSNTDDIRNAISIKFIPGTVKTAHNMLLKSKKDYNDAYDIMAKYKYYTNLKTVELSCVDSCFSTLSELCDLLEKEDVSLYNDYNQMCNAEQNNEKLTDSINGNVVDSNNGGYQSQGNGNVQGTTTGELKNNDANLNGNTTSGLSQTNSSGGVSGSVSSNTNGGEIGVSGNQSNGGVSNANQTSAATSGAFAGYTVDGLSGNVSDNSKNDNKDLRNNEKSGEVDENSPNWVKNNQEQNLENTGKVSVGKDKNGSTLKGTKGENDVPMTIVDNGNGTYSVNGFADGNLKFTKDQKGNYCITGPDGTVFHFAYHQNSNGGWYLELVDGNKNQPKSLNPQISYLSNNNGNYEWVSKKPGKGNDDFMGYINDESNTIIIDLGGLSDSDNADAPGMKNSGDILGNCAGTCGETSYLYINSDGYNKANDFVDRVEAYINMVVKDNKIDDYTIVVNAASGGGMKDATLINELEKRGIHVSLQIGNETACAPKGDAQRNIKQVTKQNSTPVNTATILTAGTGNNPSSQNYEISKASRETGESLSGKNNTLYIKLDGADHSTVQRFMNWFAPTIISMTSN